MKVKLILGILLGASLLGNTAMLVYVAYQNETLSLLPRVKNELKVISSVIPDDMSKVNINNRLEFKGFNVKSDGEYFYSEKPNSTLAVGNTYFVFAEDDKLIEIYSLSDSLSPIYAKP